MTQDKPLSQPMRVEGPPAPVEPRKRKSPWSAIAATGGLLLVKLKAVLGLLKLATLGKFAITAVSMLAMVWVEAQRSGWLFGVGFVFLILIHELGHGWAIQRAGLNAGWPVFVPFFGAMIALKGRPQSRDVEAKIAYAGPLAGTAISLIFAVLGLILQSRLCLSLGYTGFFLNLFNMIPMPPLDGGRIATVFSPRAWMLGAVMIGGLFFLTGAPQLLLIGLLALSHWKRGGKAAAPAVGSEIAPPTPEERTTWTARYFGLCFFLGMAVFFTQRVLAAQG